ncbi:hypothetical protein ACOME3_002711 [Neoechinorhynchus agilis]
MCDGISDEQGKVLQAKCDAMFYRNQSLRDSLYMMKCELLAEVEAVKEEQEQIRSAVNIEELLCSPDTLPLTRCYEQELTSRPLIDRDASFGSDPHRMNSKEESELKKRFNRIRKLACAPIKMNFDRRLYNIFMPHFPASYDDV